MYEIKIDKKVLKELNKVDPQLKERVKALLNRAKSNPFQYAIKMKDKENLYRFRIGDYRIIATIEENEIRVNKFGHRKNIYE